MNKPFCYLGPYSSLPADKLRLVAERAFTAKNYQLAIALLQTIEEPLSPAENARVNYARKHVDQADPRFANTAAVMPILLRGYRACAVAEVLGVPFGDAANPGIERLVQVVCLPSFDPEVIISLSSRDGRTTLSLHSARSHLWSSAYLAQDPDYAARLPVEQLPPLLSVHEEHVDLDTGAGAVLWQRIRSIALDRPERDITALDGMTIEGCLRDGRVHDFKVHVARGGPDVELASLLIEAASESMLSPESEANLENLLGYIAGSALPLKDRPGPPRTLRIFGRWGWSQDTVRTLRKVLSTVSEDEPVLIDLSNLRGIGTLFYPEFAPLVRRSAPTAWVRSPASDVHLRGMSVDPSRVFDTITAARAHVLESDAQGASHADLAAKPYTPFSAVQEEDK